MLNDDTPPYGNRIVLMEPITTTPNRRMWTIALLLTFAVAVLILAVTLVTDLRASDSHRTEYHDCIAAHTPAECALSVKGL